MSCADVLSLSNHDWSDLTPIPQEEGQNPVCQILYDASYSRMMDLFRALIVKNEFSERGLSLTMDLLKINGSHYTIWHYRRQCLDHLASNLSLEISLMDNFDEDCNPKNYQYWYHRRIIVEKSGDYSNELQFSSRVFSSDAKNYHAWSHRQWVVKTYSLWADELSFSDRLIESDFRNNSAWNYRHFVTANTTISMSVEISYVWSRILLDPITNESPWVYLFALAKRDGKYDCQASIGQLLMSAYEGEECHLSCFLREGIMQLNAENVELVRKMCDELVILDPIRAKYWTKRGRECIL